MNAIFSRRSVREFKNLCVEHEKIELLLKAGMSAPSACSQKAWHFYVVTDLNKLSELSQCSPFARCVRKAPLAIVPCYRNIDLRAKDFVLQDMSACVENILLEAVSLELGAVWLGIAPNEKRAQKVREVLNLPESLTAFCIVAVGYAAEKIVEERTYDFSVVHYVSEEKS